MLEDPSFQPVVSWGPHGDCFVVKDMNEFTKSILPRMFKHSNFASFVRQLNKYDFHKVGFLSCAAFHFASTLHSRPFAYLFLLRPLSARTGSPERAATVLGVSHTLQVP